MKKDGKHAVDSIKNRDCLTLLLDRQR